MVCRDCLGRTPYVSLIATVVTCLGVGIFCGTLYRALDVTLYAILSDLFGVTVTWLMSVRSLFLVLAVVMAVFTAVLLVFSFLATGATRQNVYSGVRCIMGGRLSAAFFLTLTYVLSAVWICVTVACALPLFAYAMLNAICDYEIRDKPRDYFGQDGGRAGGQYRFEVARFGIYYNETENLVKNALTAMGDVTELCVRVGEAGPMFGIAFCGALLVVFGMMLLLTSLASSYTCLKVVKEMSEYKQALSLAERSPPSANAID